MNCFSAAFATTGTLHVSNVGQTATTDVSNSHVMNEFKTGGSTTDRFVLESVIVDFQANADEATVFINRTNQDASSIIGTGLTRIGSDTSGKVAFNTPTAGITLNGGTTYYLYVTGSPRPTIKRTSEDGEDAGKADGWEIGNGSSHTNNLASWSTSANSLRFTVNAREGNPPTVVTNGFSPADGATDVAKDTDLEITFSENVKAGTGNIVIKNLDGNSAADRTIPIGDAQVSFGAGTNAHKVTINPTNDLLNGVNYAVQIRNTAITDTVGNAYDGIFSTNTTTWNFSVIGVPTLDASSITETTATLTIGNHTAKWWYQQNKPSVGTCTEVAASTSSVNLSSLTANTEYEYKAYLDGDSDADCDAADEIASEAFSTDLTAPTVLATNGFSPADNATEVFWDTNLVISFSENVKAGTGNIVIKNAGDSADNRTIPIDNAQVSFGTGSSAHQVTINPTSDLRLGANYVVNIAAGVITDRASTPNSFAGITNDTTWRFGIFAKRTLGTSDVTKTGATLTIGNHTAKWWYQGNQSGATCTEVAASTATASLSSLSAGTDYTYKAYLDRDGDGDCDAADEIASAAFKTLLDATTATVKNLDQTASTSESISSNQVSTAFTTGGTTNTRYSLSNVVANLTIATGAAPTVSIHQDSSGDPGTQVGGNLTAPGSLIPGRNTFTASGITLSGGTIYHMHVRGGSRLAITTASDMENGDVGWSIANTGRLSTDSGSTWAALSTNRSLSFAVNATETTPNIGNLFASLNNTHTGDSTADILEQVFTTGGATSDRYLLDQVLFSVQVCNAPPTVGIYTKDTAGSPRGTHIGGNLSGPSSVTANSTLTYAASGIVLSGGTDYVVVIAPSTSNRCIFGATNNLADRGTDGWSIANESYLKGARSNSISVRMHVRGSLDPDVTAPTVLATNGLSPADDATRVAKDTDLVIAFDEDVQAGTGNIVIKNLDGNSADDRTIPVGNAQVSFGTGDNAHKVTINPTNDLLHDARYAVHIAGTAIKDLANNNYDGINNDAIWNFRIIPAPTLDAESITQTGATLRIGNHTAAWWYKQTSPSDGTCTSVAASTPTDSLTGLTLDTSYTYKAYTDEDNDGDCDSADEIASETFRTEPIHVSNLEQTQETNPSSPPFHNYIANSFETGGSATDRFSVTSVAIDFHGEATNATVGIYAVSGSNPGTQVGGNLTKVGSATSGKVTFNASGIVLNGDTDYFVRYHRTNTGANTPRAEVTASDAEDMGGSAGWEIGNAYRYSSNGTTWTQTDSGQSIQFRVNAEAVVSLSAGGIKQNAATLTIHEHTDVWYFKRHTPISPTCSPVPAGTTTYSLSGLTENTPHVYKVYSDTTCTDANELTNDATDARFSTLSLDASAITETTATLTIENHAAAWWYKKTSPTTPAGTCESVAAGMKTASLSSLTANTSYTYKAYLDGDNDGDCDSADELASEAFRTLRETTPPTVISGGFSPADGANDVAVGTNLVITFSENVRAGSGNIVIKNLSGNNADTRTIPIGNSQVSFGSGTNAHKVTINPSSDLLEGKDYAVRIGNRAIRDGSDNYYAGISNDTAWNFTTIFTPGVRVTPTSLRVTEGSSAGYTVRLNTAPTGNVVIGITKKTGGDPDLSANKTSLTFNTTNWSTTQTVTISAREDDDAVSGSAAFEHAITTGAGTDYPTTLNVPDVTARERDNEGPAQPTITRYENGLSGQITVHWRAGDDRAEAWQYQYRKHGESYSTTWHTASPPWPQTRFDTIAGLTNGQLYYFRVRGILTKEGANPGDADYVDAEGHESNEVAATPRDDTIRAAPGNLQAQAGEGEVTLTWDRVPKANNYELSWSKDNYFSGWYSIGNVIRYTVTGLSDIVHTFWVRAFNHVSYGPQSEPATATPLSPPPTPSPTPTPAPPTPTPTPAPGPGPAPTPTPAPTPSPDLEPDDLPAPHLYAESNDYLEATIYWHAVDRAAYYEYDYVQGHGGSCREEYPWQRVNGTSFTVHVGYPATFCVRAVASDEYGYNTVTGPYSTVNVTPIGAD